jgi:uncharacterized protein
MRSWLSCWFLVWTVARSLSGCAHTADRAPNASAASTAPAAPVTSDASPRPLVIGETFHLDSKLLAERRVINVYLPPGHGEDTERYPVLYMPDGGLKEDFPHILGLLDVSIKNQIIRPFILVGIENIERRHDLTSPTTVAEDRKLAPHAGGADKFRAFLRSELKPYITAHYRVTGESAIVGESLAGLFVLETLLVDPSLLSHALRARAGTGRTSLALHACSQPFTVARIVN